MGSEVDGVRSPARLVSSERHAFAPGVGIVAAIALSCALLLSLVRCGGGSPAKTRPTPDADAPLPDLEATPIEPIESRAAFGSNGRGFISSSPKSGQLAVLPDLADKDEAAALPAMRAWLRRFFGAAIDDVELAPMEFRPFTLERAEGLITLRQTYRGVDTPGSVYYEVSAYGITVWVDLYRLDPTSGSPAPIMTAAAASDAADSTLRETPNAEYVRRDGDRPVLQYSSFERGDSRWDLVWMFRLPKEFFGRLPIVNARTGKVTISISTCGTGLPERDASSEKR